MPISRRLAGYLGLGLVVLAIALASYFLFLQSPYSGIQLRGTVEATNAQGPVLGAVEVSAGPTPCTTDGLQILASRNDLDSGDTVQVKGRYNRSTCEVELTEAAHTLTVVSQAPEPIQLQGQVKKASAGSLALKNVTVSSGPEPCTSSDLDVVASGVDSEDVERGDTVSLEGLYNSESCRVELKSSHTLDITAKAPDPIQLEGVVARTTPNAVVLQKVNVLEGPSPCTRSALQVQFRNSALAPEEVLSGDKLSVTGSYHYDDCRVTVEQPQHAVTILPVPIELTGIVTETHGQRFTLSDVSVSDGPAPCSTSRCSKGGEEDDTG